MKYLPLEREAILPRIDGIRKNLQKLRQLGELPFEQFSVGDPFDLVQHHLRLALEGVFHIGSHILSRLPGSRAVEYSEIALKLGENGVVDRKFAQEALVSMAKLRNLLVHHYADIDVKKIYQIVREHLEDIETFLQAVKSLIDNPKKLGLSIQ